MKQVYLTTIHGVVLDDPQVFSSKWKAIAHFNRILSKPDFVFNKDVTTVSVDSSTVGWITKKMVQ